LGKQSLKFNCFYWSKKFMLLPAFGRFTGNFLVEPTKSDIVFAIVNDAVMRL
jgi:uncharacterized protein